MKAKFDLRHAVTGLFISLFLIGMCALAFSAFLSDLQVEQGVAGNSSLLFYNKSNEIASNLKDIKSETENSSDENLLDVIGGHVRQGRAAFSVASDSLDLFDEIGEQAEKDIPQFALFRVSIIAIILTIIIIGVLVSALFKWGV